MNFQAVGIVVAALSVIPGVVKAETGAASLQPGLVVRTYNNDKVSSRDLAAALDLADSIFTDAGVSVLWIECGVSDRQPSAPSERCNQPVDRNEVVLRIQTTGPVDAGRYASLGASLVSGHAGDAPLFSTVFANRVASMARESSADATRVLGYAIAHEVGHLLLNDPHHPGAGLMRAVWSRFELQRNRPADWTFLSEEAETMRHALASRTAADLSSSK